MRGDAPGEGQHNFRHDRRRRHWPAARVEDEVELCTYLGAVIEHVVRLGAELRIVVRGPGLGPAAVPRHPPGTAVALNWSAAEERLFNEAGQLLACQVDNGATQGKKNG